MHHRAAHDASVVSAANGTHSALAACTLLVRVAVLPYLRHCLLGRWGGVRWEVEEEVPWLQVWCGRERTSGGRSQCRRRGSPPPGAGPTAATCCPPHRVRTGQVRGHRTRPTRRRCGAGDALWCVLYCGSEQHKPRVDRTSGTTARIRCRGNCPLNASRGSRIAAGWYGGARALGPSSTRPCHVQCGATVPCCG
jgi:hypothetical protein